MIKRILRTSVTVLLIGLAAYGCRNKDLIRPGDSIDVAYEKAYSLYEKEKWGEATRAFETVTRAGRGTQYAQDAQFYLAEAYYNNRAFLVAAAEYERFISYYPNDPRREEVDYKMALSHYNLSPRYQLSQRNTKKAIELFQLFNNNYPDSDRVVDAAAKIDELRNKLALKHFMAADFYLRTDRYKAAAIYYDEIIDQYPETVWAERGLVKQIGAYISYANRSVTNKQPERYKEAINSYEKFLQLFPQSELRAEAETLKDEAANKLAKVSQDTDLAQSNSNSN